MPGDLELPIQEFPDVYQYVHICLSLANVPTAEYPVFFAEEDTVIDSVNFTSNVAVGSGLTIELATEPSGGTFDENNQFTTDITALAANTPTAAVIDRTKNVVPAGQVVILNFADGGTNSIDVLNITMRVRTRVR